MYYRLGGLLLAGVLTLSGLPARAETYQTLFQFVGTGAGCNANAGLTPGRHGEFYGVTAACSRSGGGTVFMLSPPTPMQPQWRFTRIWRFTGAEGAAPSGRLLLGRDGALYGTAYGGLVNQVLFGSVFRLAPPATPAGAWQFTRLWNFGGSHIRSGGNPASALTQDASGVLYGTTTIAGKNRQGSGFGTVFSLTPPSGAWGTGQWTERTLCYFTGLKRDGASPFGVLARDAAGVLYGTTSFGGLNNFGTVFSVTPPVPPSTKWTKHILVSLDAPSATSFSGLTPGPDGALYGATSGYQAGSAGSVFRMVPPANGAARWRFETLFVFNGANGAFSTGAVTVDRAGRVYGSTYLGGAYGGGTVFRLEARPDGSLPWVVKIVYAFGAAVNGVQQIQPNGDLVVEPGGEILGTTFQDNTYFDGAVFRLSP